MTIADVAFDAPVAHSFSFRGPEGWALAPGQRAIAPLRGASRVGMVVALRAGADARLKPLVRLVDREPILSRAQLDLVHWLAEQSLSSVGSTCAALLPPPLAAGGPGPGHAPGRPPARAPERPELLVGAGREKRLLERIEAAPGSALVIAADLETTARWAQRLAKIDRVARLDSGVPDEERAAAWNLLRDGAARLAAGTRSAILAPLPPPASLILIDEHEAAHKPPGPPRMHSRDVALERAAREPVALLLTAATPSVETWWRAKAGLVDMAPPQPGPWPAVSIADTRGILRREPLTPPVSRAIRETLAARRRVFLAVSRLTSSLGLAAFVAPDQLLRAPDFRAGERALGLAWAAAERVAADGALIIQSQNPEHYAFGAVARQNLHEFYQHELTFRAELGYPPFRRLAVVTTRAREAAETSRLAQAIGAALRGGAGLTVYPPVADRRDRAHRIVVKGDTDLPRLLEEALREFKTPRSASRGIIDVEVDPVEWQY